MREWTRPASPTNLQFVACPQSVTRGLLRQQGTVTFRGEFSPRSLCGWEPSSSRIRFGLTCPHQSSLVLQAVFQLF